MPSSLRAWLELPLIIRLTLARIICRCRFCVVLVSLATQYNKYHEIKGTAIYFVMGVLKIDIPLSTSQINLYHFEAGSDMPDVCKADTSKRTSPPQSHRKSTDIRQNHIAYPLTTCTGKR